MDIKVFKIKINDDGTFRFIDEKDLVAFGRTLQFLKQRKGVDTLELSLSLIETKITERQKNLFKILCRKINEASQHSYQEVEIAFLSYFGYHDLESFPKDKFNELLIYAEALSNEVFGVGVKINYDNNHIEIE